MTEPFSADAAKHWASCQPTPIIRWAGSKRKLLHVLSAYWRPEHLRYVEPFAGSSCLFFRLQPKSAILSDKNEQLIETYRVLRRMPDDLHDRVCSFPRGKRSYYRIRSIDPETLSTSFERAARFLFLNRFCFNGIFRTNTNGIFNVPFSPTGTGNIPPVSAFRACAGALRHVDLRACDFGSTLRSVRSGDFVYLDPPFAVESRRVFREYGAKTFAREDFARLAKHLKTIDARGAFFLLSYADCKESRALRSVWRGRRVPVRRHVAGFTGARRLAYELIITNIE